MADVDTDLMLRVAAGDDGEFETLVGRVLPRLMGYLRRLGADRTEAEDLAQEVLVKVYRARAKYVARARFVTYLFHVARNHWIDLYRHRRSSPLPLSVDRLRDDPDGGSIAARIEGRAGFDPVKGADEREAREGIGRAIERLGPEHREVFLLAQVEGLRYQEIGEILGVPVGTVKSRMHAAVRQLREALLREGIEPP